MNKILVPTDFSKNAKNALDYAIVLAKKESAKIILVHAFHVLYITPDLPVEFLADEIDIVETTANKQLKVLSEKVKSENLECEIINKQDFILDLILDVTKIKKPNLIVMGTKGASGLEEVFMGSNTAKIIEKTKCPVIAVPKKSKFKPIKNITYATNYLSSDIDALKKLIEIAKLFNAKITLVHFTDKDNIQKEEEVHLNKFITKIRNKIKYDQLEFKLLTGKHFLEELDDYIKKDTTDLLSISTHYRNIYDKLFGTSYTKKLAYHTSVPLLAFHYKKESMVFI